MSRADVTIAIFILASITLGAYSAYGLTQGHIEIWTNASIASTFLYLAGIGIVASVAKISHGQVNQPSLVCAALLPGLILHIFQGIGPDYSYSTWALIADYGGPAFTLSVVVAICTTYQTELNDRAFERENRECQRRNEQHKATLAREIELNRLGPESELLKQIRKIEREHSALMREKTDFASKAKFDTEHTEVGLLKEIRYTFSRANTPALVLFVLALALSVPIGYLVNKIS